ALVTRLPQPNIKCLAVINTSRPHGGAVAIVAPIDRFGRGISMAFYNRNSRVAAIAAAMLVAAVLTYELGPGGWWQSILGAAGTTAKAQGAPSSPAGGNAGGPPTVNLTDLQLGSVKVEPASEREFAIEKESVGSIDFNQDLAVQVFTPYQGRIIGLFAKVGDDVQRGQTLFTIDSPDLLQAESTLISAAGVAQFTTRNLARLKDLYATRAVSQKELEQATSDQQAAEGALRTARNSVRLFGKSATEIDRIIEQRMADPTLVVPSPITGRVTARNAAPGLFVQPGNAPAPYTVADINTMWMIANVAEADSPQFHVGQAVTVSVLAFPGRAPFEGKITTIASSVDA